MRCRSSPRSVRGALRRQHFLRMLYDLQQARARKLKEIKSELRVLEIDRAHVIIRQRHRVAALDAFDGLRPAIPRRQQSELAENLSRPKLIVQLDHPKQAAADQEHLVGAIAFAKENVARPVITPLHV